MSVYYGYNFLGARDIMSVSGHKRESSVQNYATPSNASPNKISRPNIIANTLQHDLMLLDSFSLGAELMGILKLM